MRKDRSARGNDVTVYNRTRSKAEQLEAEGAHVADRAAEACASGTVLTMLGDDAALEHVAFGQSGILGALDHGGLHVSHSRVSADISRRLAAAHDKAAQQYVSPVFGRPESVAEGRLVVLAAGAPDALSRARPLLDAIGQKTFIIGPEPGRRT
jgi:3-hydroxyisobutyrate dehydrogenase-like beta-hydroxyacid dehydrogenase